MRRNDRSAEEVLDYLLDKVGETKRRRRAVKGAAVSAVLVLFGWLAIKRPSPETHPEGPVAALQERRDESAAETLAVVVWRNGVPRLEELGGDQLADLELDFSLEPVIAYSVESW